MEEKKKVLVVYIKDGESHSLANSVMSLYEARKKYTKVDMHFLCLYAKDKKSLFDYIAQNGIGKVYIHSSLLSEIRRLNAECVPYAVYDKERVNAWRLYWSIIGDKDMCFNKVVRYKVNTSTLKVDKIEMWKDESIIIDGKSTFVAKEEAIVYLQKLQDRRIQDMEDTIKHMSERLDKIKFERGNPNAETI